MGDERDLRRIAKAVERIEARRGSSRPSYRGGPDTVGSTLTGTIIFGAVCGLGLWLRRDPNEIDMGFKALGWFFKWFGGFVAVTYLFRFLFVLYENHKDK